MIVVTDDGARHAMETKHFFVKNFSNLGSSVGMGNMNEMAVFGESINDNQNSVMALGHG